jgi:hypothetical protein
MVQRKQKIKCFREAEARGSTPLTPTNDFNVLIIILQK